jgi:serine protease Do
MKKTSTIILTVLIFTVQVFGVSCSNNKSSKSVSGNNNSPDNLVKGNSSNEIGDFVKASKAITPAVVHIETLYNNTSSNINFEQLYDSPSGSSIPKMGSASGVIISRDGYIATNNHVVENASDIKVILPDKRVFSAKLIGRDPSTDLALIKIKAEGLPTVIFGNSDIVQVGQWVLAVGFPFSLNTTVTAGIVSAKSRSIGIINQEGADKSEGNLGTASNSAIESFIQTDAAINPGNSGGALVNTDGELIGINSAIASQTGSYAGYSFAIPVNLAKKILDDLKEYGSVKRGILGVAYPAPSTEEQYFTQQGITPGTVNGVFITNVISGSAAEAAGLKEGDIIKSIDGVQLTSSAEFSERIARHRPNDIISLSYLRSGKTNTVSVTLKGEATTITASKSDKSLKDIYTKLGASFEKLTDKQKNYFNINSGVLVTNVLKGGFFDKIGIPMGTIIAFINSNPINNLKDIDQVLLSAQRGIIKIFAITPDGSKVIFSFSLGT